MKNMDLDIPIFSGNSLGLMQKIKPWVPPGWLSQTVGTEVQCRLCVGGKMCIVASQGTGQNILKYCLACKGTGKIRI